MNKKTKVIIALGGNALQSKNSGPTAEAQLEVVKKTCGHIARFVKDGYQIAIVHGNGPQVGRILQSSEAAANIVPAMPFDVCGAMSEGYIGYHIQQAMRTSLRNEGVDLPVVTLVTQVVVDKEDPGFQNPTKPIGSFYSKEEAEKLTEEKGFVMKEDAGRGYRRVVASPKPKKVVEIEAVRDLWEDAIVVTCGGGGIPVIETENGDLEGVAAVIDKDHAAELLAENLDADILLILTEVEKVCINWGKPEQVSLDHLNPQLAEQYIREGHFAPGSMLPKVQACVNFVNSAPGRKAIITSLDKAADALSGLTGTVFTAS